MKKHKGFTLLEILIALAILVIGIAAVVNLFPVGLHASKRAADFTMAGMLAQEKMAELMYLGYNRLNEVDGGGDLDFPTTNPSHSGDTENFPSPDDAYSWWLSLDSTQLNLDNLVMATLQIYWLDRGVERYAPFVTYIANYEG